jgi:hypothetical protein
MPVNMCSSITSSVSILLMSEGGGREVLQCQAQQQQSGNHVMYVCTTRAEYFHQRERERVLLVNICSRQTDSFLSVYNISCKFSVY